LNKNKKVFFLSIFATLVLITAIIVFFALSPRDKDLNESFSMIDSIDVHKNSTTFDIDQILFDVTAQMQAEAANDGKRFSHSSIVFFHDTREIVGKYATTDGQLSITKQYYSRYAYVQTTS
jgi:uncharacterized protein YpmS